MPSDIAYNAAALDVSQALSGALRPLQASTRRLAERLGTHALAGEGALRFANEAAARVLLSDAELALDMAYVVRAHVKIIQQPGAHVPVVADGVTARMALRLAKGA